MGLLGSIFGGICDLFSSAVETFCDGVSLVVDSISSALSSIGEGIKSICEAIGSEGMLLIGSIALSLLIPGFGLPEIFTLIQIVAEVAKMLNVGGEDSPEELGMKAEIADKKPDDFDSTEEYIKYLNEEVELEKDAVDKLTMEEKAKYGLIGSSLDIMAIKEKYNIELSPDFLRDVTIMKLTPEEVGTCVKDFADKGIEKMQDMTDYMRGNSIESDKSTISSTMLDSMKSLYPELSDEQLENRLSEMEDELRSSDI